MLCQTCGNETPDQGLFCLSCGTRVNKECPRCAEIIKLKAKVCRFCGYEFTPKEMTQIEKEEQVRQQQQQKQQAEQDQRVQEEREKAKQDRVRKEKSELEKRQKQQEEEFRRFHPPDQVSNWGRTLLKCPKCSTLNSIHIESCRRCSASLKSAPRVKNPYI